MHKKLHMTSIEYAHKSHMNVLLLCVHMMQFQSCFLIYIVKYKLAMCSYSYTTLPMEPRVLTEA